jgi:hypothetical protein
MSYMVSFGPIGPNARVFPVRLCKIKLFFDELTISLRCLSIILIVLRLEVSVWISLTEGKGVWLSIQVFLLSPLQCNGNCRNFKRLREFEEMESSRQSCGDDFEYQEEHSVSGFRPRIRPQFSSPEHMLKTPSALKFRPCACYYPGQ